MVRKAEMKRSAQPPKPYSTPPPGLLTRVFFRLPVYVYRAHLGWIFDHRVLYLEHVGRKTGRTRRTCIEVIHHDPAKDESFVISAYGRRSDWFRNIMKNPPLELRIGKTRFVPEFRVPSSAEAKEVLRGVFLEHPGEGKFFLKNVFHLEPSEANFEGLADLVPLVAFWPKKSE
jgi:deazaflavin-dependent oxidoreductase (nitroreductase family)